MEGSIELKGWHEYEDGSDELVDVEVSYYAEECDDDGSMGYAVYITRATYDDELGNTVAYEYIKDNEDYFIEEILKVINDNFRD